MDQSQHTQSCQGHFRIQILVADYILHVCRSAWKLRRCSNTLCISWKKPNSRRTDQNTSTVYKLYANNAYSLLKETWGSLEISNYSVTSRNRLNNEMARVLQLRNIILVLTAVTLGFCLTSVLCAEDPNTDEEVPASEKWKKKDIRDYSDADMERLYQQWEVGIITFKCPRF